jgi:hypothetical protein
MTARPVFGVLLNGAGFGIWAAHFGAIYAVNALACERGLGIARAAIGGLTVLAAAALLLLLWQALRRLDAPLDEGGEAEPRFTRWFAAGAAALGLLGVLFQAAPALVLPSCG